MSFADVGEEEIGDSILPEVEVVAGSPPKIIADEAVEEELLTEAGLEPCAAPRTEEDTAVEFLDEVKCLGFGFHEIYPCHARIIVYYH